MSIFGGIFRALGFESEGQSVAPVKKKVKNQTKASFNLKKDRLERPDKIDGLRVIYIEGIDSCRRALTIFKAGEPVIINLDSAEDKMRALGFFEGYIENSTGKLAAIEENRIYVLLPEGVEIE